MLLRAHKILIGTCVVFCLFFAAVQLRDYQREGELAPLVRAALALLFDVGLLWYLIGLLRAPSESVSPEESEPRRL